MDVEIAQHLMDQITIVILVLCVEYVHQIALGEEIVGQLLMDAEHVEQMMENVLV